MWKEQDGQFEFNISEDMKHFYNRKTNKSGFTEVHRGHLEKMFTRRKMFVELFNAWGEANNLDGYKILEAHGGFKNGKWNYYEHNRKVGSVQDWINKNDGSVTALMITSCNPHRSKIKSCESLVLHTSELTESLPDMFSKPELVRIFVPGMGYMEKDYKGLRTFINELSK